MSFGETNPVKVLGFNDRFLRMIEDQFPMVQITARDHQVKVLGQAESAELVFDIIQELLALVRKNRVINELDVNTLLNLKSASAHTEEVHEAAMSHQESSDKAFIFNTNSGVPVRAKTPGQQRIIEAVAKNDIVFAIGPAGTGKTFTSVALAVQALKLGQAKKIVLVRPAVEAGESLGFLPGGLKDKIDPYLRPLYDALEEMLDYDRLQTQMERHIIEIAPLAYMRGRTLNKAFVILDEAQNATQAQMKMFLTRLGVGSKAIITGDVTQTDLPREKASGLVSVQPILKNIEGISFVKLDRGDVVRHRLIREIIKAYEQEEGNRIADGKTS